MRQNPNKYNYRILLVALLPLIFFSYAFKSWLNLQDRLKIMKNAEEELRSEKEKKESLEKELAKVLGQDFIEKQARDRLNMGKEEEIVVILPTLSLAAKPTSIPVDTSANWERWLKLFLGGG